MGEFFKSIGRGLLGIIAAPFYLVFWLGYCVYGLGLFLFLLVKLIVIDLRNLFSKKGNFINPFKELEEDKKLKLILEQEKAVIQNPAGVTQQPAQNVVINNFYGVMPNGQQVNPYAGMNPNQIPTTQPLPPNSQLSNDNTAQPAQFNYQSLPNQNVINPDDDNKNSEGGND